MPKNTNVFSKMLTSLRSFGKRDFPQDRKRFTQPYRPSELNAETYRSMLGTDLVNACLNVIVNSAFKPFNTGGVFKVVTDHPIIQQELTKFFDECDFDLMVLTLCKRLYSEGNILVRLVYNEDGLLTGVVPELDFTKATPFVYEGQVRFYQVDGEQKPFYEYHYAQLPTYINTFPKSRFTAQVGDTEVENEYLPSESWLSPAVDAWRFYTAARISMHVSNLDRATARHIWWLPVSSIENSQTSLDFYQDILDEARHFNYSRSGIQQNSIPESNVPTDLVLPYDAKKGEFKHEVLNPEDQKTDSVDFLDTAAASLTSALGVDLKYVSYKQDTPTIDIGDSSTNRYDEILGRTVSVGQHVICKFGQVICLYRLLSMGYNVDASMFSLQSTAPSTVDGISQLNSQLMELDVIERAVTLLDSLGVGYNKNTLANNMITRVMGSSTVLTPKVLQNNKQGVLAKQGARLLQDLASVRNMSTKKGQQIINVADVNMLGSFNTKATVVDVSNMVAAYTVKAHSERATYANVSLLNRQLYASNLKIQGAVFKKAATAVPTIINSVTELANGGLFVNSQADLAAIILYRNAGAKEVYCKNIRQEVL